MTPVAITAFTVTTAVGRGNRALINALKTRRGGLRPNDFTSEPLETWIGRVEGLENEPLPSAHTAWECRNNRLAWLGLQHDGLLEALSAARKRYAPERIGLFMGTSTSSIGATEQAYSLLTPDGSFPSQLRRLDIHDPGSLTRFLQAACDIRGPAATISTACSSSAKVFAQAERLISLGVIDAALVGGVDTLCGSVLFGFNSLELVSRTPCRPFDVDRDGISLGEAAGFALLERAGDAPAWLIGHGESSDAHHMSTPHPEGLGARIALQGALDRARITPRDVQYVNLHGTASARNDEVEARLIADVFPADVAASSTKGWTGHTLGTAGIVEAIVCLLAIQEGHRPGTLNTKSLDPVCGPQIRIDGDDMRVDRALTASFGFGGNNCVLAFARSAHL